MTKQENNIKEFLGLIDGKVHTMDPLLLDMYYFANKFREYLDAGEGNREEIKQELIEITAAIQSSPISKMISILESE